jgi:hypothetical protein
MLRLFRPLAGLLSGMILLAACAPTAAPAPQPSATAIPAPTATPAVLVPAGTSVAGVELGGLTVSAAEAVLQQAAPSLVPAEMTVLIASAPYTLTTAAIGLEFDLAAVTAALQSGAALPTALFRFDAAALTTQIAAWAEQVAEPAQLSLEPVEGSDRRRGFVAQPARILDRAALEAQLTEQLSSGAFSEPLSVTLTADPAAPMAAPDELSAALSELAAEWDGVVGVYVYDLVNGQETTLNARTVFAGASTIKTAIMLFAYTRVAEFDERLQQHLRLAIHDSDNLSANELLAAGAGGSGTDDAMVGAVQMTEMLADLGLEDTYLTVPYESGDYIRLYNLSYPCGPRDPVGEPPYTETGCALRATPYAMGQLYRMIEACADGDGVLLERYDLLSPERCNEMLDLLAGNADSTRMMAGLPAGLRVEHKSGWIEDMQADAGIIRSPNGDYVAAIYVFRPLNGEYSWPDSLMAPMVADVSYLIYSAFNPTVQTP